uniref:MAX gene-associated protein n=1 Tax=Oryzias latipes TaxID=8090 RepID=A0A3P9I4W2_ORYLA
MMSAPNADPAPLRDSHAVEGDEKGDSLRRPLPAPTSIPCPSPAFPAKAILSLTDTSSESKAVSMASTDSCPALSFPAEASPAKPAVECTLEGTSQGTTSQISPASDGSKSAGTSVISISNSPSWSSALSLNTFGYSDTEKNFPPVITMKGVSVTLENNSVWKQFSSCGTEMILTKQGRRMFPYCRYRLSGLDPDMPYMLVLSIVPSTKYRYRWNSSKWEVTGQGEHLIQGVIRAFSHHYSPCKGSDWMSSLVSFYKLKLTNNFQDQDGHIILHSMHRYIPKLHVVPLPKGVLPKTDQPVQMGPESLTFTFPQTEFMAVTTYQNFRITQLKINHNPFAKGFREEGINGRWKKAMTEPCAVVNIDTQHSEVKPAEHSEDEEGTDLSSLSQSDPVPSSTAQPTRLVLKPIMSNPTAEGNPYVSCIRGRLSLGELVLVQKPANGEPSEEHATSEAATEQQETKKWVQRTPCSSRYRRKKRINRRWGNPKGRNYKATPVPTVVPCSPLLQPELDDIDGLLFASFVSKEALDVHVGDESHRTPSPEPPGSSTPMQLDQSIDETQETVEESITRLELALLEELRVLKHRQVIHPVLQEVGLKLSSLDPSLSVDLQYLGISLPLPSADLPEQISRTSVSPVDKGHAFISRTGKTSDMTKIKGWKSKFIKSSLSLPSSCEGLPKNLSAFCSNMLDEYLESEEQQISERAAAFSTKAEASVSYQLPAKSSSYVKTLDSVLKSRSAASRLSAGGSRPCPLSYKLQHSSALSSTPAAARPTSPCQAEVQSRSAQAFSGSDPGSVGQSSSAKEAAVALGPPLSFSQIQAMFHKPSGLTKIQLKLLELEMEALNRGLRRTQLTAERVTVALSSMQTEQMQPKQEADPPETKSIGPVCGKEFCRLGCVCSSLQHVSRGPLHCRRPDCMFGCTCFKRKITKQQPSQEREEQSRPVYSVTNMELAEQPRPGAHSQKLWRQGGSEGDPEPLFVPRGAPPPSAGPSRIVKRGVPRPAEPIREEDKDPVYRYLESKMTCARVRELNSKPPPVMDFETSVMAAASAPKCTSKPQNGSDGVPLNHHGAAMSTKKEEEKSSREGGEAKARKQIQIQSECEWKNDCQMVLEGLCDRMNQNRLNQPFFIGPYHISPITKILMRKPSGCIITYRIRISRPSNTTNCDEEESDECDELNPSFSENPKKETGGPSVPCGVTPFMSGIAAAGNLIAKKKPFGGQGNGLVKVNGKQYNHARLLLGYMGALHPVNRLAAFVTGRAQVPVPKVSEKPESAPRTHSAGGLQLHAGGTTAPPVVNNQPSACPATSSQTFKPEACNKALINSPWCSPSPMSHSPVPSSTPVEPSSRPSPVSLTVSPSLKSPSFLAQRGTYSFRICPPSNLLGEGKKQRGVALPGGFTLIQLPKPRVDEAAGPVGPPNARSSGNPPKSSTASRLDHLAKEWLGVGSLDKVTDLSRLICDPKTRLEESSRSLEEVESNISVEDLSSDFSSSGEGEDDDELIDIETVEEEHEKTIVMMKEAALKTLLELQDYSLAARERYKQTISSSSSPASDQEENNFLKSNRKRRKHTKLERLRRCEQRALFEKLKTVLNSHPKTPKYHLLSLAEKEIRLLEKNTKTLREKKKKLIQIQSEYIRKLSRLSGRSEISFHNKLQEMSNRHKLEKRLEWNALSSTILGSSPAPLNAPPPKADIQQDNSLPSHNRTLTFSQNGLQRLLSILHPTQNLEKDNAPPPLPTPVPEQTHQDDSAAALRVAPPPLNENQTPASVCSSTNQDQHQAPSDKAEAQTSGRSSATRTKRYPLIRPTQTPLPLVRSKTGRIILPSSLRPIGQGFYTLMVIKPKQDTDEAGSSSDPVRPRTGPEDVTASDAASSDPDPSSGGKVPLREVTFFNKSGTGTPAGLREVSERDAGARPAQLRFNSLLSYDWKPDPGAARPRRGRPRKQTFSNGRDVAMEASESLSETSAAATETPTHGVPTERTGLQETQGGGVFHVPDRPPKKGRGRPPKRKSSQPRGSSRRVSDCRFETKEDSPVRISSSRLKGSDSAGLSRPLTRGSMGKDFPSAKKRSWEDIEKELDPDLEFDKDHDADPHL